MATNTLISGDLHQEIWVGLDLAKRTFDAAVCLAPDKMPVRQFPTSARGVKQMLSWCDQLTGDEVRLRVVMEATGSIALKVFSWLYEQRSQCAPAVINPHYIKSFGESLGVRNKTDKADARVIARYGRERRPAGDKPKSPEQRRLRALCRERQTLVEELTAEKNRASEPCDWPELKKMRRARMDLLKKQIKALEKAARALVANSPDLKRDVALLKSVPGVGFIVAISVISEIGDLRRFEDPRKLAAFCGLSPRQFSSGTSVRRRTRMCKKGNKRVRPMVHLGARALIGRTRYALGRLYDELLARGKTKSAAIGVLARRIILLMRAVLLSGRPYNEQIAACGKNQTNLWENPGKTQCTA
jgi:transposase